MKYNKMNVYKDFIQRLRKFTLDDAYIILGEDVTPMLRLHVRQISEVKFEDGSYHTYYGDIKKIIVSFINYYTVIIDDVIKEADKYIHTATRDKLLHLMERTISIHVNHQITFGKDFLPVHSALEKKIYDEIHDKYHSFMVKMHELRDGLERLDKQDKVDNFVVDHFKVSVEKTSDIFEFTHVFIAMMLADRIREIGVSLEEILLRMSNNLKIIEQQNEDNVNKLLIQLYDRNKEGLLASRRNRKCSAEKAEIDRGIEKILDKIDENSKFVIPLSQLEEEVAFWQDKVKDFKQIYNTFQKLKTQQEELKRQEEIYNSSSSKELPGTKQTCWDRIGENYAERMKFLKEKIIETGKVLITFFSVRGNDRILYDDNFGSYYVDEFNHQVYVFNHGMATFHVNCKGEFKELLGREMYYFDEYGRYVRGEKCEKVYQLAGCTSSYNLREDTLLKKVTEDCGHSEAVNRKCKQRIKDPNDVEILPVREPIDIKGTLQPEVVKYLWDSFGCVLPDALHDVGRDHSKNPIHYLAHKVLQYKYTRSLSEMKEKRKEASAYRANIYKERKEKAIIAAKAWKAKLVKRRKPEESDDSQDRAVYDAQIAAQHFINSLNYFND